MGNPEKKPESTIEKIGELSRKGFGEAKKKILNSSHKVKTRLDLNTLKKERTRIVAELGEDVLAAVKGGKLRSKLFDDLIANIENLSNKIEEREGKLNNLKEQSSATVEEKTEDKAEEKVKKKTPAKKEKEE